MKCPVCAFAGRKLSCMGKRYVGGGTALLNAGLATYGARAAKARRVLKAEAPVGARASWGGAAARARARAGRRHSRHQRRFAVGGVGKSTRKSSQAEGQWWCR